MTAWKGKAQGRNDKAGGFAGTSWEPGQARGARRTVARALGFL